MKRLSLLFICVAALFATCDKLPDDDNLNGKWQMLEMYSSDDTGHYSIFTDKRDSRTFWSFQLGLLQINSNDVHNGSTGETFARFTHNGDNLFINEIYVHYRDRDSLVADPASTAFSSVGIRGNATHFLISRQTGSQLILTSPTDSLVFYKIH